MLIPCYGFSFWFWAGADVIPWLGKLTNLGPAEALPSNPYGTGNNSTPFPLKVSHI